ncbi:MAG: EamA family transporter [Caldilineaceae bacterium]
MAQESIAPAPGVVPGVSPTVVPAVVSGAAGARHSENKSTQATTHAPARTGGSSKRMTIAIAYILVSVFMGAIGQITLKQGMLTTGQITLSVGDIGQTLWKIGTNPYVIIGLTLYATGTIFWLAALSRVDLSYAYPFASMSYVVMLLASWQLFDEHISPMRLVGTLVIGLGVLLISRT